MLQDADGMSSWFDGNYTDDSLTIQYKCEDDPDGVTFMVRFVK